MRIAMSLSVRTAPSALYWCGNVDLRERDDVYYYILWRLKLEGETENMGVCTKERKGVLRSLMMFIFLSMRLY